MQLPGSRSDRVDRSRPRVTYERVASTLALLLVLTGGTAFAASKLITGRQIAKGTITAKNIKSHSLLSLDFKSGQLPAGARGPRGAQGIQGVKGDTGATGTAAASGIVEINLQNNAEFQPGSNVGFPGNPIHKGAGKYCIPMPTGINGDNVAAIMTPDGGPSVEVQTTATDCADTTHWIEVYTYSFVSEGNGTFGFGNTPADATFNIALP
jgi:hypothetical protein